MTIDAMRLVVLVLLSSIRGLEASPPDPRDAWEVTLGGEAGIPRGFVQVRENQVEGTRLALHGDLGVNSQEVVSLGIVRQLGPRSSLRLAADWVVLDGGTTLPRDVFFNGATLQGGTRLDTRPDFFRLTALYEHHLLELDGGGFLAGDAGLTFVLLTFKLRGTLAPKTADRETQEDFVTQELPVPILGLRLEKPISDRLDLVVSVAGGCLPFVDSLRQEGGDVKLQQSHADLSLGIRGRLSTHLDLAATYRFTWFAQHEISGEDDNLIHLWVQGVSLSLAYRF